MSFDFFNPSNLAFGSKLAAAFTQLNGLADAGEENLEKVFEIQETLSKFDRRNYIVPKPTKGKAPCRTNEIFDLLNDTSIIINKIEYSPSNGLVIDINLFNRTTNRMTKAMGSSKNKKGYCYVKQASSNQKPDKVISIVSNETLGLGTLLFQYEINKSNDIIIIGDTKGIECYPGDGNIYSSISKGEDLSFANNKYVADDYECVCLIGKPNNIQVKLNGRVVLQGYGSMNKRHCILYLKPDDEVSGTIESGFRINYNN